RHPGQRRRDPLLQSDHEGDRGRNLRGQAEGLLHRDGRGARGRRGTGGGVPRGGGGDAADDRFGCDRPRRDRADSQRPISTHRVRPGRGLLMAEISAKLVKELRDRTGAGMMACKQALEETNGDIDAAVVLLRERGMASAAKRAGRETTEGKVGYRLADDGRRGTIVAVGCETEPVSNNDEFLAYAKDVLEAVDARGAGAEAELEEARVQLAGKLGENVVVVGATRFERVDGGVIAAYAHP